MTTSAPAAPKAPEKQCSMAAAAASRVSATVTPLPADRPSALTTMGIGCGFEVGERGCLVLEAAIGCGRNAELGAEILGKALGAFELGCGLRWPEHLDPRSGKIVGQAGHQRHLRPNHHKADIAITAEADDGGVVGGIERHALGHLGNPGIAGRAIEPRQQGTRGNGPGQGMLAPAGTDQ